MAVDAMGINWDGNFSGFPSPVNGIQNFQQGLAEGSMP